MHTFICITLPDTSNLNLVFGNDCNGQFQEIATKALSHKYLNLKVTSHRRLATSLYDKSFFDIT